MPQGDVIKCMAIYDAPWWRDSELSGQAASDAGPVCATFDNTPQSGAAGVLLAFVEGCHALELRRRGPLERRLAVQSCLERLFGPQAARNAEAARDGNLVSPYVIFDTDV